MTARDAWLPRQTTGFRAFSGTAAALANGIWGRRQYYLAKLSCPVSQETFNWQFNPGKVLGEGRARSGPGFWAWDKGRRMVFSASGTP